MHISYKRGKLYKRSLYFLAKWPEFSREEPYLVYSLFGKNSEHDGIGKHALLKQEWILVLKSSSLFVRILVSMIVFI